MDSDPRTWRPMGFGRRGHRAVRDPIVEPAWDGVRVLAYVRTRGATRFVDVDGFELTDEHPDVAQALTEATSEPAVLDGYLTDQATRSPLGLSLLSGKALDAREHTAEFFLGSAGAKMFGGAPRAGEIRRREREIDAQVEGGPIAFVAVDLVVLDGQPLTTIPLLERKRLLESVVGEADLVRRTPFVRAPLGSFYQSWRSLGFASVAFKAANSRYFPGEANDEWALVPIPRR